MSLIGAFMRGNKPPVELGVEKGFSKDKTRRAQSSRKKTCKKIKPPSIIVTVWQPHY